MSYFIEKHSRSSEAIHLTIEIQNVSWKRDGKCILQNINWTVESHENWAVVGLNGSGKTSLLGIISGNIFPSEGEVSVLGRTFGSCDLRELRKSIGWVSSSLQESLLAGERVEDIVLSGKYASIGLYDIPSKKDRKVAADLMDQFGCSDLSGRTYATLSQGERQRVMLARALMSSPKLLVLDEPCTGLDIFAREQFLSALEVIAASSGAPTMLYVSHHIEEILPIFSNTLLLRKGKVHSRGKTKRILTESNLSDFFQSPVEVSWRGGRPRVHLHIKPQRLLRRGNLQGSD